MDNSKDSKEIFAIEKKAADRFTVFLGSWKFIFFQTIFFVFWIIFNVIGFTKHWDSFPFILLNLLLGFQAAYAAPIILMSDNRAAERDRKKAALDLATDRKAEREIEQLQNHLKRIELEKLDKILEILKSGK
ncbi:MAG: hypothetical protein A2Z52_02740 [Candidatus Moranbacteria bacterium RBG_19FT_COMBO_42_6]|nr:MAG: hypothetical protein A2Z52_02740 [Candidatus Moranbacteria bacterium RBG_19FT_COMBO_42_6]